MIRIKGRKNYEPREKELHVESEKQTGSMEAGLGIRGRLRTGWRVREDGDRFYRRTLGGNKGTGREKGD